MAKRFTYHAARSYSAQTRTNSSKWWGPRIEESRVRYSKLSMMTATNRLSIWRARRRVRRGNQIKPGELAECDSFSLFALHISLCGHHGFIFLCRFSFAQYSIHFYCLFGLFNCSCGNRGNSGFSILKGSRKSRPDNNISSPASMPHAASQKGPKSTVRALETKNGWRWLSSLLV